MLIVKCNVFRMFVVQNENGMKNEGEKDGVRLAQKMDATPRSQASTS